MTSPSPLLYDTYYHIYNRGTNRGNIFIEERNYQYFLTLYTKHLEPVVDTYAYCLLRNHFHILLRVKSEEEILETLPNETLRVSPPDQLDYSQDSLACHDESSRKKPLGSGLGSGYPSRKFSDFFNAYAKGINKSYGRTGSLFQHPFGRVHVTSDRQFWNVVAYIHQNPQKHRFVDDFRDWKYSSYGIHLAEQPTHLKRDEVLAWFGDREQYRALHETWVTDAQSRWLAGDDID